MLEQLNVQRKAPARCQRANQEREGEAARVTLQVGSEDKGRHTRAEVTHRVLDFECQRPCGFARDRAATQKDDSPAAERFGTVIAECAEPRDIVRLARGCLIGRDDQSPGPGPIHLLDLQNTSILQSRPLRRRRKTHLIAPAPRLPRTCPIRHSTTFGIHKSAARPGSVHLLVLPSVSIRETTASLFLRSIRRHKQHARGA